MQYFRAAARINRALAAISAYGDIATEPMMALPRLARAAPGKRNRFGQIAWTDLRPLHPLLSRGADWPRARTEGRAPEGRTVANVRLDWMRAVESVRWAL